MALPTGETFTVEYVNDKSWSGYNWYQGGFRSLIQVNTDLPIFIDRAIDLACHEGYPGHHVYNALLEKTLVRDRGWVEFSVYALFCRAVADRRGERELRHRRRVPGGRARGVREARRSSRSPGSIRRAPSSTTACTSWSRAPATPATRPRAAISTARSPRDAGRGVADDVRADGARARAAAREVHRAVPQLRHQLQPRQGPGARLRRARSAAATRRSAGRCSRSCCRRRGCRRVWCKDDPDLSSDAFSDTLTE